MTLDIPRPIVVALESEMYHDFRYFGENGLQVSESMFSLAEIATYNGMEIIRKRRRAVGIAMGQPWVAATESTISVMFGKMGQFHSPCVRSTGQISTMSKRSD